MKDIDCGARHCGGKRGAAQRLAGVAAAVSVALLSACTSPTYGTGKPADQQLLEDVTGILSVGPKDKQAIDYGPRPGIVKPPSTAVLPPPQEDVAQNNPAWPESPEERLARIRAEATANQDNPFYRSNVVRDMSGNDGSGPTLETTGTQLTQGDRVKPEILSSRQMREQRQAYLQRRQQTQGSPTTRRYLSDPPVDYRQPAPTAPADELGVDEEKKERAAKRTGDGSGGLRKLWPW
ncbi:hypothetical protein [Chelativorans sp. AA-79]|uniref:hypothetical protein n=1 Tax=Chelativorans sp. AA-79 TaxID=3028735 RepID=UPI0023F81FDF|nr:hypothetical protein [Chelativorans sp. AA-79]WEX08432.1 hypothetical protein PVE73_20510 [Chelativorans sp. AA-79]